MSDVGDNLAVILSAWTAMLRSGSTKELASILDPNVVWQGIRPDQACDNRKQVVDILSHSQPRPPRLSRIEAEEIGDRVVVSVAGPDFPDNGVVTAIAPRSLVFTFHNRKVVRMESVASRDAAFEAAAR